MSYILDALRKAEAERRSGAVPDIHAAPAPVATTAPGPQWRLHWIWLAVPAVLAAATAAWLLKEPANGVSEPPPVTVTAAASPSPPPLPAPPDIVDAPRAVAPARKKEVVPSKEPGRKVLATSEEPKPETQGGVVTLSELPQQIQRELPALAIGGYIYSGNKAERSILVNKRLLREGDEVAPGLRLESMTPTGMVLNYKGYRYRRSYQ